MRALILVPLLLAACGEMRHRPDQCLRAKLFKECIAAMPPPPAGRVSPSDWKEWAVAADQCDTLALVQSKRDPKVITPECGGDAP